jgi:uncharacterized protein (DUF2126 family)
VKKSAATRDLAAAAAWAEDIFARHDIRLTIGGEPTYIPLRPEGPEWSHSAVGPTKLKYARHMAASLLAVRLRGGAVFFSPGKSYPGEINPRWALRLLRRRDGKSLFDAPASHKRTAPRQCRAFLAGLLGRLAVAGSWIELADPLRPNGCAWVLPLDFADGRWISSTWRLNKPDRSLTAAEGPAGLRLPLHRLPQKVTRRALVVEILHGALCIFFPPLVQEPFADLLEIVGSALKKNRIGRYDLQGYIPSDEQSAWIEIGLTADPGVLEVNLPPCESWREYDRWIATVTAAAAKAGLRTWKRAPGDFASGTGGGNHIIWGGPTLDENPFFTRPAWLAAILRYWQRHPSLAYLFTGCYVGASSQAPRPDESARPLFDLEMAYRFLERLPAGDNRTLINETLRHIHTDVTGNTHRSEISFDKFWNPHWPNGAHGLIEFRAVESLPKARWMSAVAVLWSVIAALMAVKPERRQLKSLSNQLHDVYFLPTPLRRDLHDVLADLAAAGCPISANVYDAIWNWRFPVLLRHEENGSVIEVRRAHEDWPLLSETPIEGGTTSRFVDTSMHRLEVRSNRAFAESRRVFIQGRHLPLTRIEEDLHLAGLRYRRSCLYPCLHPGIAPHLPLKLAITPLGSSDPAAAFEMPASAVAFRPAPSSPIPPGERPCRPISRGALTHDLRLE